MTLQILGDDGEWADVPGIESVSFEADPPVEIAPRSVWYGDGPRGLLVRRLVERHGLTRMTARAAVIAVERGNTGGRYAHLVHAEADAVMRETAEQLWVAFRPLAEALTEAFRRVAAALPQHAQDDFALAPRPPARRDRPAWQSPYGPPARRSG